MIDLRQGDCLELMKDIPDGSIDAIITDPPYGYSFMGKDWDKAVPSVEIWQECLRVIKPGGWCMVMSAPRSDVQNAMISRLMEAGFRLDFTPIYWTYASGFPKAGDVAKLVDKRLGVTPQIVGTQKLQGTARRMKGGNFGDFGGEDTADVINITEPTSPEAKALKGAKTGFQPKPAVEVIIVAMKPLSEKTYVDQALKNGRGITWLDDCRVPAEPELARNWTERKAAAGFGNSVNTYDPDNENTRIDDFSYYKAQGRFPANLLVSDDVLNDGTITKSPKTYTRKADGFGQTSYGVGEVAGTSSLNFGDSGSYSRYFDLDKWAAAHLTEQQMKTFPFAIFPKASKSEKNKGLEHLPDMLGGSLEGGNDKRNGQDKPQLQPTKNGHPTVKPLKLMSYLITLTTREGDTVLDPFMGSGTTGVACKNLNRNFIGIELDEKYFEIAKNRIETLNPNGDKR